MMPEETGRPLLAVIVLAVAADPLLVRAVKSIIEQDEPCEVIVVNSKGGDASGLLEKNSCHVKVIETASLLFPGGARNRGIAEAKTPYVAFLASDCIAAPGWARERLKLHQAGHGAVSSAMMHDRPLHLVAWADQLLLFPHRLPHLPQDRVILFGVSFARNVFDRYGLFSEALRTGEDSEFLERLEAGDKPVWAPRVITLHRNNTNLFKLLRDQYRRGHRFGIEMRRIHGKKPKDLVFFFLKHSLRAYKFAREGLRGRDRLLAIASLPLVALGCFAKAAGILSMRRLVPEIDAGKYADPDAVQLSHVTVRE